jgi:hypothetical protein
MRGPVVALVLVLIAAPVLAQTSASGLPSAPIQFLPPRPARLEYDRPAAFAGCPDERYFHHFVGARLGGIDPFTDNAKPRITVKLSRDKHAFVAELTFYDQVGKDLGGEKITDLLCTRLVDDAGRAVVQWLMLVSGPAPAPAAPASAACPAPPPVTATPAAASSWGVDMTDAAPPLVPPPVTLTPPEPKTALSFRFGAGLWGGLVTYRGAFGFTLDAGVRYGLFSAAIEGRGDPPLGSVLVVTGASVRLARATGALLGCLNYGWWVGCAKGEAGRLFVLGDATSRTPVSAYGAAGVRMGLEFPAIPPWFVVRVAGEVLGPITSATITSRGKDPFQVAAVNAGLGFGALFVLDKR